MSATRGLRSPVRDKLDRYYTPTDVAVAALGVAVEACPALADLQGRPCRLIEPSVGGGAWVTAARHHLPFAHVVGVDLDPTATGLEEADEAHLGSWPVLAGELGAADLVLGNPPYRHAEAHLEAALTAAPRVLFLLRMAFLAGQRRSFLWRRWPPAAVWVLDARPSFTAGGGTDSADYAAILWDRDHRGPVALNRLCWRNPPLAWTTWSSTMNATRTRQPAPRSSVAAWAETARSHLRDVPEGYRLAVADGALLLVPTDLVHEEPEELGENQQRRIRRLVELA